MTVIAVGREKGREEAAVAVEKERVKEEEVVAAGREREAKESAPECVARSSTK